MKVYVNVKVVFNKEGQMRPCAFEWEDGRVYKIDRVTPHDGDQAGGGTALRRTGRPVYDHRAAEGAPALF